MSKNGAQAGAKERGELTERNVVAVVKDASVVIVEGVCVCVCVCVCVREREREEWAWMWMVRGKVGRRCFYVFQWGAAGVVLCVVCVCCVRTWMLVAILMTFPVHVPYMPQADHHVGARIECEWMEA
jgi:hypothetical protein